MAEEFLDPDYTSTECRLGIGSTFGSCATEEGTYENYGEITKISLPKSTIPKLKATNMQSLHASQEYRPGLNEPGECTVDMNLTRTSFFKAQSDKGKTQWFQIFIPADGTDDPEDEDDLSTESGAIYGTFLGYISEVSGEVPVDAIVTCQVKVTISGDVDWATSA